MTGTDRGCLNGLWEHREMVQTFLHQQTNDAVRVKEEIPSVGIFVSDDRVQSF